MHNSIKSFAQCQLPTEFGNFLVKIYRTLTSEITVIVSGNIHDKEHVAVRIHSACFTGEVLGSQKCDCKQQLDFSLQYIAEFGGMIIYLPQEGRGIGLGNKIKAYSLQEIGYDTVDANQNLGLPVDSRTYEDAIKIIKSMQIRSVDLITNNPLKIKAVKDSGIKINELITFPVKINEHSAEYIRTKFIRMGHQFKLDKAPIQNFDFEVQQLKRQRPFVHINFALAKNGQTTSDAKNSDLSCQKDWERVHLLREKYCAIAVGKNTWKADRPRLTAREEYLKRKPLSQPARVIFAGQNAVEVNKENRPTFIVGSESNLQNGSIPIPMINHELASPLEQLYEHQVSSLLVEGGMRLIHSFLDQHLADLITVYVRIPDVDTAAYLVKNALPCLEMNKMKTDYLGQGVLLSIKISENSKLIDFATREYHLA